MHVFDWLTQYMTAAGQEVFLVMLDWLIYLAIGMGLALTALYAVAYCMYRFLNAQWRKNRKKNKN